MCLLSKVNIKQTTRNIDKMKYKLKPLRRSLELIVTNSKSWNTIKSNYLRERLMNAIQGNIVLIIDTTKTIIERLGK